MAKFHVSDQLLPTLPRQKNVPTSTGTYTVKNKSDWQTIFTGFFGVIGTFAWFGS